jgi:hemerythrin-like metal-binding protein
MTILAWTQDFVTGLDTVDEQHRHLVDLVNAAAPVLAAAGDATPERAERLLGELADYAVHHFTCEERLMRDAGIDPRHVEHHAAAHRQFGAHVAAMSEAFRAGDVVSGRGLLMFVANWLVFHILGEDQSFARQQRAIAGGRAPAEAFTEAGGLNTAPTREVLASTLVDMYMQLSARNRELERHRLHLEDLVAERTARLNASRSAAEAFGRQQAALMTSLSHELRAPVSAMLGMADLLATTATAEQQSCVHHLQRAGQHVAAVIESVLDLAKLEAGKVQLEDAGVSMEDLLADTVAIMSHEAAAKGLALTAHVEGCSGRWRGDPTRLQQGLLNYVKNAMKFTPAGSVTVRARALAGAGPHVTVRFEVEDTGPGIDAATARRLFRPFEQADAATTRLHGGTGLGLAITRELAQLMGGESGVERAPSGGSLFWFTARLKRDAVAHVPAPPRPERTSGPALRARHAGTRVLLVDDDEVNREVGELLLSSVGLVADVAADGAAAVEMAARNRYALVLMDMQMPGIDGPEAARRLRFVPGYATVPIVALTGNDSHEDRARCLAAGMNDFLGKPVRPEVMYGVVLKWLETPAQPHVAAVATAVI